MKIEEIETHLSRLDRSDSESLEHWEEICWFDGHFLECIQTLLDEVKRLQERVERLEGQMPFKTDPVLNR